MVRKHPVSTLLPTRLIEQLLAFVHPLLKLNLLGTKKEYFLLELSFGS